MFESHEDDAEFEEIWELWESFKHPAPDSDIRWKQLTNKMPAIMRLLKQAAK